MRGGRRSSLFTRRDSPVIACPGEQRGAYPMEHLSPVVITDRVEFGIERKPQVNAKRGRNIPPAPPTGAKTLVVQPDAILRTMLETNHATLTHCRRA